MRIYNNCYQLMSETGRNLWEMGAEVKPHTYQNKLIKDNPDFITKELICEQYCLTSLKKEEALFAYDKNSFEWANKELEERLTHWERVNPGSAWWCRKDIWESFLNSQGKFDYTYNERLWYRENPNDYPVLGKVIEELKRNPDTRQAIVPIYSPNDVSFIGGVKRVPCSVYYSFLVRTNPKGEQQVNICYHQRSSDFVTHFGNDVWLAWKLMEFVAQETGYKPGYLFHTIDSLHSYAKDWDKLKTPINTIL